MTNEWKGQKPGPGAINGGGFAPGRLLPVRVNTSPNNTGLKELPPCRPVLLWYSDEKFPLLGGEQKGKNIMSGPVYRVELYLFFKNVAEEKQKLFTLSSIQFLQ